MAGKQKKIFHWLKLYKEGAILGFLFGLGCLIIPPILLPIYNLFTDLSRFFQNNPLFVPPIFILITTLVGALFDMLLTRRK
jgi:hypothetical protein